ncbi:MAG: DUF1700 domain-containing protein [Bacilli bacterium]|nr:DUF1700 domain-containing protein [Bacilli bacterium]
MEFKTQEEYLLALAEAIKYLNPKDATKVLRYYETRITNAIEYGEKEEDVIRNLPDVETVAKETYESHGVNYLAMRKKIMKRKETINNIFGVIVSFFIIVGFFVIMYFLSQSIINMFSLLINVVKSSNGLDKFITPFAILLYILCIILLSIYVIDLFLILIANFLGPVIKLKDQDKHRKIFTFTITGFIEDKCKHQKVQPKLLVSFIVLLIICMCVSYSTGGYFKKSLNDTPSHLNTLTFEDNFTDIVIKGYNGNINFKSTDSNTLILEHQYEFEHNLNLTIENNTLNINLEMTKSYDVFNLLNEPTQNLIIYIPNSFINKNILIEMDKSIIDISDINNVSNVDLTVDTKGTISLVNSKVSNLNVKGYEINLAIAKSSINDNTYIETSKGQTLVQQESNLNNVELINNSSYIKFENSTIQNLKIENASGTIEIIKMTGTTLDVKSRQSVNTYEDSEYDNIKLNVSNSSKLTLTRILSNNIDIVLDNSQLLLNYVKGNTKVNATSGTVYLSGVGENHDLASQNYNSEIVTNVKIYNKGSACKIEAVDSKINDLLVNQEGGFINISKSTIITGSITATNTETIDLLDLKGSQIDLFISNLKQTFIIDAEQNTGMKYVIKTIDTLSFARLFADEETVTVINEAANANE